MAEPSELVQVRDAEGRRGTVAREDVPQLLASGGSLETEESLAEDRQAAATRSERTQALERMLNPVQALAGYHEAIARGATLGLSDVALTETLGGEYRQGALARAQNPATAIPELGGAAGSMVAAGALTGGAGLGAGAARAAAAGGRLLGAAGGAGEALGAGAAARLGLGATGRQVGGLLGRGAAEGAVFGAGQEVSAAALEDRDLTVDKLMAAAGHGALMGGGMNVALGGGAKLLGAAGKVALEGMTGGQSLSEAIGSFGRKRAFKATTGNAVRYYNEATNFGKNPERIERIGQKLLDDPAARSFLNDPVAAERHAREKAEVIGQQLRSIADQLDAQGTRVDPRTIVDLAEERIAKLKASSVTDFHDVARKMESRLSPARRLAEKGESYTFSEAWKLRRDLDKITKHAKENRSLDEEEVSALRNLVDDVVDDAVNDVPAKLRAMPGVGESFGRVVRGEVPLEEMRFLRTGMRDASHLRSAYSGSASANDVASGRVVPPGFSRPLDPIRIDIQPGAAPILRDGRHRMMVAQENGATEIRAIVSGFDDQLNEIASIERVIPMPGMPRQGPDLRSAWLKAKEDYSDFRLVRDALQKQNIRNEKNRAVSPSDYFSGGMAFLSAVASGGSALAALATSAATAATHKALREKGPGAIARIADRISKLDKRTDKAIAAAIEGKPKDLPDLPKRTVPLLAALSAPEGAPTLRTAAKERERYERTLALVRDLGGDSPSPEAMRRLGNATADLADDFPELASMLHQRVLQAARALNARAPLPLRRMNPLQQHLEDERIPAGLISKWLREVDAADTPESIWHDLAKGRVPREKIEIVKLTNPHLFEDWRSRVIKYVAEKQEKLSRPQRIRLSLAFDFTGDPSISPERIAQTQSEIATEQAAQQQAQPAPPQGTDLSTKQADEFKPATEQSFLATG